MGGERVAEEAQGLAARIVADVRAAPVRSTAAIRLLRRGYSRELAGESRDLVLGVAGALVAGEELRWLAYELVGYHKGAIEGLGAAELVWLGRGMDSWDDVDSFARTLSGPAWLRGYVGDGVIAAWAHSDDLWWRRAALVSTVALNTRSQGGTGDIPRTLAVCRLLVRDREDMVEKAMSWALRELVVHDAGAVRAFLAEFEGQLGARVKRKVRHKLATGLRNPRRG